MKAKHTFIFHGQQQLCNSVSSDLAGLNYNEDLPTHLQAIVFPIRASQTDAATFKYNFKDIHIFQRRN